MRRRRPESRKILPDPVFSDLSVAKFVNYVMEDGKIISGSVKED